MLDKKTLRKMNKNVSWRKIWIASIIILVLFGVLFTSLLAYGSSYEGRVLPGVHVDDIDIGGMSEVDLRSFLQDMNTKLVDAGMRFFFLNEEGEEEMFVLDPTIVTDDNFIELIGMDVEKELDFLLNYQKTQSSITRSWSALVSRISKPHIKLRAINVDRERLFEEIENKIEPHGKKAKNAGVVINSLLPFDYSFVSSSPGVSFQYDNVLGQIISDWSALRIPEIHISSQKTEPEIHDKDVQDIISRLPEIFGQGSLELKYTDAHTKNTSYWNISESNISKWIEIQKVDDGLAFGLSSSSTIEFLENTVAKKINKEAQDAKFKIGGNNRVTEFQGSRPGFSLDVEATYQEINNAVIQRTWHDEGLVLSISVVVEQVEPNVKTGEINELGIKEILGIGYSNFSGSPPNRIKNIRHAVKNKLEGLLISPDEEFSLISALKPFTLEGGYLPELVIKGDEIKPEIAGGLCQIGSTIFRTAMNSGLPITARRNHSLVVNYYNDHRNGLPGTDATIYDPAPDFKFLNDTGNYILVTTDMNVNNGDLFFTMWGTNDGRNGYYTEPVVHRWIPVGETKYIETTDLEPGVEKCQGAHTGAETSFTYVQELPSGEKEETVYSSYYRPLPKICLVGVEELSMCQELPDGSEGCAPPEDDDISEETEDEKIDILDTEEE